LFSQREVDEQISAIFKYIGNKYGGMDETDNPASILSSSNNSSFIANFTATTEKIMIESRNKRNAGFVQNRCASVRVGELGRAHIWINFTIMFLFPITVNKR